MRIAIFGDIHANLEALEAVILDAETQSCTDYICMGDIVGYNASPAECLERVRGMICPTIKGNHDEEASSTDSLDPAMNPVAVEALLWTRKQLSVEQAEWLRTLRMVRQFANFTVVHSSLDQPNTWNYVLNKFDAMASFSYQFTQLCFHGHTHVPRVYCQEGTEVIDMPAEETVLLPRKKYFVNVGSVGQPRDGDWRSCYCIYDIPKRSIVFRRLEYDLKTTQQKIMAAGLPEMLATRLESGQ